MITEQGGVTSHAAVLAREMGIPAVTGVDQATQRIRTGDWLLIDGDRGEVTPISGITPAPEPQHVVSEGASDIASEPLSFLDRPSRSLPSQESPAEDMSPTVASITGTQLFVTLSQTESIAKALALPIDGVGLLRSELMLLEALQQQHPDTWIQQGRQAELTQRVVESLQTFAHSFAPHPVFYRSVDWRSDEFGHGHPPLLPDPNPALGARGSLRYQLEPALFEIELAALRQVQQQGYSNLHLILPFVRTVEEFLFCRQRVEQAGLRQNPQFQLWIMAEVPSVLLLLPDYIAAGIQGIAIGSNDLTQLLLGVDRNHPQLAAAFDQRHPAVLRAMRQIIQTARQAGIPCSLCGQAPSRHPEIIDELVRWGITAISVDLNEVVATRAAIVRAEQRLLLELAQQRLNRHPG
jgi:pyruvate, water dikinase